MKYLSIDPGFINCGYVVADVDETSQMGTICESAKKEVVHVVTRDPADYYVAAQNFFASIMSRHPDIGFCIIENVYTPWAGAKGKTDAIDFVFRLGLLVGALYNQAASKFPTLMIPPSTVKRSLKIKGKPGAIVFAKSQFLDRSRADFIIGSNDHVADCLNQLHYYLHTTHHVFYHYQ